MGQIMISALRAAAVLVLLALILIGCGSTAGANSTPVATTEVDMPKSYRFSPEVITVKAGSTVTWTNSDNFTHSVRLLDGSGTDKVVERGQSVSITFDKPGEYDYDCRFHSNDMKGKVIVTE